MLHTLCIIKRNLCIFKFEIFKVDCDENYLHVFKKVTPIYKLQ